MTISVEKIEEALAAPGYPIIKHVKTGKIYNLLEVIPLKLNGKWVRSAVYFRENSRYVRLIEDFSGFEYIRNKEISIN